MALTLEFDIQIRSVFQVFFVSESELLWQQFPASQELP